MNLNQQLNSQQEQFAVKQSDLEKQSQRYLNQLNQQQNLTESRAQVE